VAALIHVGTDAFVRPVEANLDGTSAQKHATILPSALDLKKTPDIRRTPKRKTEN